MFKTLPILCFSLLVGSLMGQTTVTANYLPEEGDSLKFSVATEASFSTVELGNTGGPNNWDLTGLEAARTSSQLFEAPVAGTADDAFLNADLKVETTELSTNYYRVTPTELILIGNIGASDLLEDFFVTTPFTPGYVERRAPLEFINTFTLNSNIQVAVPVDSLPQAILDAAGMLLDAADSVRFSTVIERSDLVDAYGTADLGDESFDVLRERREEIRSVTVEAYNFILGWVDITDGISALPGVGDLLATEDTVVTYTLWSDASIDPIAVFTTETDGSTVIDITYKTVETTSSIEDNFLASAQVKMFPNPARTISTFEASGLATGQYELRIHSIIGRKMLSQKFEVVGNQLRSDVDVSKLPSGLYLYSLVNSRGRILATKRLFVGG